MAKNAITVKGFKEIEKELKYLEPKMSKKVIRQALRAAWKPFLPQSKANAPVLTGEIREGFKIGAGKRSRRWISFWLYQKKTDDNWHTSFPEFGTSEQPAQGFMRKTFDEGVNPAKGKIESDIAKGFEREFNKK